MVTYQEMRLFAEECVRWSEKTGNASQRELMIRIAKTWIKTASAIERRLEAGDELIMPDLRSKLD